MRVLNFILPNFEYLSKSQIKLGDTLGAINTLIAGSKEFPSYNRWSRAGLLAKSLDRVEDSKLYFGESFKYYENYLENKPKSWGYHLSLLEVYLIGGEIKMANNYIKELNSKNIEDKNYKALLQYFNVIIDNVIGDNSNDYDTNYELVKSKIQQNDVSLKTWSFELLLDWNELSELSQIKRKQIKDLSDLFKN